MGIEKLLSQLDVNELSGLDYGGRVSIEKRLKEQFIGTNGSTINKVLIFKDDPDKVRISFEAPVSKINYATIYKRCFDLNLQESGFEAKVYHDSEFFFSDDHFDISSYSALHIEKDVKKVDQTHYLKREDKEGNIRLNFYPQGGVLTKKGELKLKGWIYDLDSRNQYRNQIISLGRDLELDVNLELKESEKQKLITGNRFQRFGKGMILRAQLKKDKLSGLGLALFKIATDIDPNESEETYKGRVSPKVLEYMNNTFNRDFLEYAKSFEGNYENQDPKEMSKFLRELASQINQINLPNTFPGSIRITKEQAKEFLFQDLEYAKKVNKEIPLSSVEKTVMRNQWDISGRKHHRYLDPLFEISGLNWKDFFNHTPSKGMLGLEFKGKPSNDPYNVQVDPLMKYLKSIGAQEIAQSLKLESTDPFGDLTVRDVYGVGIDILDSLMKTRKEELTNRYLDFYVEDSPTTRIKGEINSGWQTNYKKNKLIKNSKGQLPNPNEMNSQIDFSIFEFRNVSSTISNPAIERIEINNEDLSDTARATLVFSITNPQLLPAQQSFLDDLDIRVL